MSKEIYISSTPHETRLAIVENDELAEIYYERENEYTLAGSIYNGKVTRVLPGMQSSFVDIGLERDAFLYITDFMEEAGDSADFETSANGADRAPRGDRNGSDRGSERGGRDRGPRPERSEQARLPERSAEPSDADLFTEAVSGLDPNRPVAPRNGSDSDRGDRGSRRGGRNRRDRGAFNSDGTPRRDRGESGNRADRPVQNFAAPTAQVDAPVGAVPAAGSDEVGEGSPGADGSRRWRGRRGRRGNRGPGREGQPVENAAAPVSDEFVAAPVYDEPFEPGFEPGYDMGASAEVPVVEAPQSSERGPREGSRNDRGGRGGRDRGGNRGRGGREGQQAPRVPRGFAPSLSLYKVEGAADEAPVYQDESLPYGVEAEVAAPSEPVILPGESLSKYRPGGNVAAEKPAQAAAPVASTEFALPGAWDGGLVLPGETIRPRGPSADSGGSGRSEGRGESRGRDDRGSRDSRGGDRGRNDRGGRGGRDDRGGRNDRDFRGDRGPRPERSFEAAPAFQAAPVVEAAPHFVEAEQAAFESGQGHVVPVEIPAHEETPHTEASHAVAPIHSTFVPPPPMPGTEVEVEAPHEAPTTFVADHVAENVAHVEHQAAHVEPEPEFVEQVHEFEPTEASASFRVDPVPPSEYRQAAPVLDEPKVEAAVVEHDVTSISATGEMHSEPVHEVAAVHEEAVSDAAEENAPFLHEVLHEEATFEPAQSAQPTGHFQPGHGHLEEEEMFEEDEEIVPAMHAHSSEVYDQSEQETLEGAADLGTMLREMSIDQITRTEPSEDEEDDFEEDFLEEDQDFESASGEGEFEEDESTEEGLADEGLDEVEDSEYGKGFEGAHVNEPGETGAPVRTEANVSREPRRDRDDRGRRDGRNRDRNRRDRGSDRGSDRSGERGSFSSPGAGSDGVRSSSERGSRDSRGGRNSRQSMQSTNLPAISDLLKPGQEILCQIAKEPIAKKGARITSHIALPGRFLVFMPTVNHTGVSRKIESDSERRRLKEILLSEKGDASGGFIVRTAASGASEEELRSDLRFLLNLWTDIKTRSESSKSPALIYHDLNLVERVLRDQVTDTFSAIWVDTETEYERVLRFLQRFQPSLIRRVKLYTKETPLFEQFGITEEINKALRSKVWLKSGGSIVINQTEALVAIDINTGKFVGKTARLEDTIVKTNLDAIPEIVRQIRLRDLGGIIIIDFIDMDERKNRNKVMAALEEELKSDRAPSKVLQFNDFGLVAITRKRVKQSLERTLSTTCGVCAGTGMVKSAVTVCNDIYVEMRKMHKHLDRGDVMLRVNPEVVKQLKAPGTKWLQEMEEMCGKTILVKSDPSLHPEQFDIH